MAAICMVPWRFLVKPCDNPANDQIPRRQTILNPPREKTMNTRSVVALKEVDPAIRAKIEAATKAYDVAFNKSDAAAICATFAPDVIETGPYGPAYGREACQQRYADEAQKYHPADHLNTIEKMYMLGDNVAVIQRWKTDKFKGWVTLIFVPKGDDWLVQLATWNYADFTPPPATPSPAITPSSQ
jgi:ketosteroid isomerase-like protein